MFETNVFGVVALTSAAIPTLRANNPSVVCTITSSSIIAAVPFFSAYRASKAAVSAFGDSLRVEVAPFGIRVVEILPGPIDTDMFRLSTGEQDASRFDNYRALADVTASLRREHADPRGGPSGGRRRGHCRRHRRHRRADALWLRPGVLGASGPVAAMRRRDGLHHDGAVSPGPDSAIGVTGPLLQSSWARRSSRPRARYVRS